MPRRKVFSNREKLLILSQINERQSAGESLRSCCRYFDLQPSQVRRWRTAQQDVRNPEAANRGSVHVGRGSILSSFQQELLRWFFELREPGFMVSVRLFTLRACELSASFRRKTNRSKDCAIRRFLVSNKIVLRAVTHECQRPPGQLIREALDFIEYARPKIVGPNRHAAFVLNRDQTPIFFDMSSGRTLRTSGERTVNGCTTSSSTLRVTVSVTVTTSGELLKPMIVFKGKPGARIETREFPTYPIENFYACQDRAWMDDRVMRSWIRLVLKPYVEGAPPGVQPVLFLDSFRCHMMASVVNDIHDLGVQIETIPGGCTGLCQPIDIGIGKPLKSRARHLWEEWIINEGVNTAVLRPPSRLLLSQWITDSIQRIRESTSIVRNSWRHGNYSYFPNEETVEAQDDQEDMGGEQESEGEEEHSGIAVEEQSSLVGEEEQQEAPRRDPGWDDTSDSNYEPSSSDSSS